MADHTKPTKTFPARGLRRQRSRQGYHLNMFCMSLMKAENREAFKADEPNISRQFPHDAPSSARRS